MINSDAKVKYCPSCLGKNIIKKEKYNIVYKGIIANDSFSNLCPICKDFLSSTNLTLKEWNVFKEVSCEPDFVLALDKLKKDNPIEFELKMQQFIQMNQETIKLENEINIPKCPTCGSTNIQKISNTKRWIGVGLVGLASTDIGKTFICINCKYKW